MLESTVYQIIIFFVLIALGGVFRLLYSALAHFQKRFNTLTVVITDVLFAIIAASVMFVTCFLFDDSVRIFHAVFFLGGVIIVSVILGLRKKVEK